MTPPVLTPVPDPPARPRLRRPFGVTADRREVVADEAAAIRDAARRVLDGDALSAVVRDWNTGGLTTAGGGPWRVNSLSSLLIQPRLVSAPQILDGDTHAALVALHASRRKQSRRPTRRYLLSGLLRCWRCGGGLRGMPRTRGADLYACPGPPHGGCSGTAVTADHADDAVRDLVLARLDSPAVLSLPVDARAEVQELAAHRQRLEELAELWASGEINRDEWLALRRSIARRVELAEAEVARLARMATVRQMAGTGRLLRARWPTMTFDERRDLVVAALDHVVVAAAEPPRQLFRPERLQPRWVE